MIPGAERCLPQGKIAVVVIIGLLPSPSATTMTPDIVLELSVEQLISALNKKLTVEYTKAQPTTAPGVATLAAEVRLSEPQRNRRVLTTSSVDRRPGETSKRDSAWRGLLKEPSPTSKSSPS